MVKIRLTRMGKKKQPSYRIVVADSRCPRNGKVIENIGTYNPRNKRDAEGKDIENKMFVKQDRLNEWLSKGAQPTDSVRRILVKLGIFKPETPTVKTASKKKDKKEN